MRRKHLNQARDVNEQFKLKASYLSRADYEMLAYYDNNIRKFDQELYEIECQIRQYNQRKSKDEAKKT